MPYVLSNAMSILFLIHGKFYSITDLLKYMASQLLEINYYKRRAKNFNCTICYVSVALHGWKHLARHKQNWYILAFCCGYALLLMGYELFVSLPSLKNRLWQGNLSGSTLTNNTTGTTTNGVLETFPESFYAASTFFLERHWSVSFTHCNLKEAVGRTRWLSR